MEFLSLKNSNIFDHIATIILIISRNFPRPTDLQ